MITEIPTADEFEEAGINLLHLAWRMAVQSLIDLEEAEDSAYGLGDDEVAEARANYWTKSQPALGNAFSLIQQSVELALKGRIARISPYLLISRDPKDWPRGADGQQIPFSAFRTVDAADLVKIHNTFADKRLPDEFREVWDTIRRERNALMHSVSKLEFRPPRLISTILTVVQWLYERKPWTQRLIALEADDKYAMFGYGIGFDHSTVMRHVASALDVLEPAQAKLFFGFDKKRRAYACPKCRSNVDSDYRDELPNLAQLASKSKGETRLNCPVCGVVTEAERTKCVVTGCNGTVIHEGMCLACQSEQDSPYTFDSGLDIGEMAYELRYSVGSSSSYGRDVRFDDDATAIEHGRLAMSAPNLQKWQEVEIATGWPDHRNVGKWVRNGAGLEWVVGTGHRRPPFVPVLPNESDGG